MPTMRSMPAFCPRGRWLRLRLPPARTKSSRQPHHTARAARRAYYSQCSKRGPRPLCWKRKTHSAASAPKLVQALSKRLDDDPSIVSRYNDQGFMVFEDALSPTQLEKWRAAIDNAVENRGSQKFPQAGQEDTTNVDFEYYDNVFTQRVNLWQSDAEVKQLLVDVGPELGQVACRLEGNLPGIRLWHDQALYKQPFANPTAWHFDVPYWSFSSPHAISVWVALDDATLGNGCMWFLEGSHKVAQEHFAKTGEVDEIKIGKNMPDLFKIYPEMAGFRSVPVKMKAGTLSFHNGMLVHGAGANMGNGRRRAMTFQLMPDGSVFNGKQNVLTNAQWKALQLGDSLDDTSQNPLLYHEKREPDLQP